jgi:hypothetical protein
MTLVVHQSRLADLGWWGQGGQGQDAVGRQPIVEAALWHSLTTLLLCRTLMLLLLLLVWTRCL